MLVMAIMGLLGTISIGSFRAMRRGMEQSAVRDNVKKFIETAQLRAMVDRQPTAVYFWNETRREESDSASLLVVGHAVAVRRSGRITAKKGSYLIDEFGDLRYSRATDDEGEESTSADEAEDGIKMYLYKMNGNESGGMDNNRSEVSQATFYRGKNNVIQQMMTDPEWADYHSDKEVMAYGWCTTDDSKWKIGDAYGSEFAEITLPNNYIFGSQFSEKVDDPIKDAGVSSQHYDPNQQQSIVLPVVSVIRPDDSGKPAAKPIDMSNK